MNTWLQFVWYFGFVWLAIHKSFQEHLLSACSEARATPDLRVKDEPPVVISLGECRCGSKLHGLKQEDFQTWPILHGNSWQFMATSLKVLGSSDDSQNDAVFRCFSCHQNDVFPSPDTKDAVLDRQHEPQHHSISAAKPTHHDAPRFQILHDSPWRCHGSSLDIRKKGKTHQKTDSKSSICKMESKSWEFPFWLDPLQKWFFNL